jgi:ketosteroid isomerase-like protein
MRSLIRLLVAFIATLIVASLAPTPARADAKDEIMKLIPKLDAGIKSHDTKTLGMMYDPDGKFVTDGGELCDQKRYIALLADPTVTLNTAKSNSTSFQDFGDTVVEMGTFTATGTQKGKPIQIAVRYMSVWVKKNGMWVITAEQDTKAPTSTKAK